MRLNLKQLEAFVWVADLRSFRRAADRLNTTQPNISARIAALEDALGTRLLTRDAGSVQLTGKGQVLLVHARRVLDATDALVAAAGNRDLLEGTLRLGVTEMIVHTWLRDYLRALKDQFPNLTVELTVDLSANLEKELAGRTIDLALQNAPFSRLSSGQIDLGTYPLVWVAEPGLLPVGDVTLDDLAQHPILTHARNTRLYEEVTAHISSRRDLAFRLVPSSNLAACLQMTVDGMGIATLPAAMVATDIASGALVPVSYAWSPAPLHFFARYDAERSPRMVGDAARVAFAIAQGYDQRN
ncbi:LysR family transcriptional regulator [Yoonia sp.]|uniref:LysR family transcriptional regulator n=1 Tax=Yoonia sp. TaxID=2212373 RepID=UPI001A035CA0|nr:LysR family transcriptional regulator [Yoonia sp.]MBE0414285.1 LysR family transcriptional regulator [Yoonia sp.]